MSQQQVGQVYNRIIDEVCDASRVDFEEGGVDAATLKLLKQRWQGKLSALEVGHFPWDPPPQTSSASVTTTATPTPQSTPTLSTNPPKSQREVISENGRPAAAPPSNAGSRIKAESGQFQRTGSPSLGYPMPQIPQLPPGTMNVVAQQRAAQALHQQYGPRAAAQITQLQQSSSQRHQSGLPTSPYQDADDRKPVLPPFPPIVSQSRPPLQSAQQDGAGDSLAEWKAELARRRALAAEAPGKGDRLFHEHMLHRQQLIEGGGVFTPLEERHMLSTGSKRRVEALLDAGEEEDGRRAMQPPGSSLQKAQGDTQADNDEEEDEDAINSDLDDPDDTGGDPEDETVEQVMLCTYDKVQRVKNKWKCTLKDGILRVANKEYVFHKGQGEFEW